ncbi:MAG: aminoacyl-tRNA hydrolase [Elusimicrobia bacterium]|nr:aminoacyl-tRNA hydrolase [Elusimicrobiota bacterium]
MRLVVGLGNPGPRYARTRHNAGFRVVEALAGAESRWRDFRGLGRCVRREGVVVAEPLTYMNDSGSFVSALCRFHKVQAAELLVCFDDISLPLGRLRLKAAGSSGGQKGMESIIAHLGTAAIPRLRVGVGPLPPGWEATDFVLGRFAAAEETVFARAVLDAADAVRVALQDGLEAAMNRFNSPPPRGGE